MGKLAKIVVKITGGDEYALIFGEGPVAVFRSGETVGYLNLNSQPKEVKFFKNMVVARLPYLVNGRHYRVADGMIYLPHEITEMFGEASVIDLINDERPGDLYYSPRARSYEGGEWVILSVENDPIIHFRLMS